MNGKFFCLLLCMVALMGATPVYAAQPVTVLQTAAAVAVYEPSGDEEDYWEKIRREIKNADGQTIPVKADNLRNLPAFILREMQGKNITLEISRSRAKIYVYGGAVTQVPANKVFYSWEDLFEIYGGTQDKKPAKPDPTPADSSLPDAQISTLLADEPQDNAQASSDPLDASSSQASQPEGSAPTKGTFSEQADPKDPDSQSPRPPKPKRPHRSIVPLVIAGIVILCAVLAGWVVIKLSCDHDDGQADDDEEQADAYEEDFEPSYPHRYDARESHWHDTRRR